MEVQGAIAVMANGALWLAIEQGAVTRATMVWREGMDSWKPVGQMPELALALTLSAPGTLGTAPFMEAGPDPPPARTFKENHAIVDTLVSGKWPSRWQRISSFVRSPKGRRRVLSNFWLALGSAVAASAITAGLLLARDANGNPSCADPGASTSRCGATHTTAPPPSPAPR